MRYAIRQKVKGSSNKELNFFNLPNPSSRSMTLGFSQHLTEMSIRNISGRKVRPACKSVALLSRKCVVLDISQSYKPPMPVRAIGYSFNFISKSKKKAIPLTGRGGL
jgi:hypothetical protein